MSFVVTLKESSTGLDSLVAALQNDGFAALKASWQVWFEQAAEQLECDDSFDPQLTDQMVDCLVEAEDALLSGGDANLALKRLVALYHSQAKLDSLEELWLFKASQLGTAQLETETWNDLHKALEAAQSGRTSLVERWLDCVEEEFLAAWEGYEATDVLEEEITTESVLCHRFLLEGVEGWLEALTIFRETLGPELDRSAILRTAEQAQRLLILVQLLETEAEEALQRYFVHYN